MTTRAFQKIYTKIDNITKATVTLRALGVGNDELATVGGKLAVQSETAMKGIRIMFYYAPLAVFIAILALLLFYKLDREYDGIMKVLDERHKLAEQANA